MCHTTKREKKIMSYIHYHPYIVFSVGLCCIDFNGERERESNGIMAKRRRSGCYE